MDVSLRFSKSTALLTQIFLTSDVHCLYVTIAFEDGRQFSMGDAEWQIFDNNHTFVIYDWC